MLENVIMKNLVINILFLSKLFLEVFKGPFSKE